MASFDKALTALFNREGVYSKDPDDAGGETYRGITRRNWPQWKGWAVLDASLEKPHAGPAIEQLASDHYRERYWIPLRLDDARVPDSIGTALFLASVLTNPHRAIEWLQRALNSMNNQGERYPDVELDGSAGPDTLDAIAAAGARGVLPDVLSVFRVLQAVYYVERIEKRPQNEKYARGWIKRALEV